LVAEKMKEKERKSVFGQIFPSSLTDKLKKFDLFFHLILCVYDFKLKDSNFLNQLKVISL
jgi:hypothetical protein